jgi:hypothetical protein
VKLEAAQKRGRDRSVATEWPVDEREPLDMSLPAGLITHAKGKISLGLDLGTTTKEKSNPTALAAVAAELDGFHVPSLAWWKTSDPRVTKGRVKAVVASLKQAGIEVVGLGIDGTSETFFAKELASELSGLCEVTIYIGSANVEGQKDVDGFAVNVKAHKGNRLSSLAESDKLSLPGGRYVYDDFMLVKRRAGSFDASIGSQGQHGDTFDAVALGILEQETDDEVTSLDLPRGDFAQPSERSPWPSWMTRMVESITSRPNA